ncbi:MAG: right-handed parallel beta-helix repeat-containing protein [Bacteroidota bacterium]
MIRFLLILTLCLAGTSRHVQASSALASSFGYDPSDATPALRAALSSSFDTIIVDQQSNDWNVGPSRLFDITDKVVIFEPGVVLRAIPGAYSDPNDCLLQFWRAQRLSLIGYGASFVMNQSEYAALNDSEWRHCLSFWDANDIVVRGLELRDSGGDGLYIGGDVFYGGQGYSKNVLIEDVRCLNNYRQGMSIISAENLTVRHCEFSQTQGTLPEAGVDLEPDVPQHRLVNINFEYCSFTQNGWAGIALALRLLDETSLDISIRFADCYLSNNHRPGNSYAACEIFIGAAPNQPVGGTVDFERCLINGSDWSALYSRKTEEAYQVNFQDCVFQDISRQTIQYNEPIFLEISDYDNPSPRLGGFSFNEVLISYATDFPFFRVFGWDQLQGLGSIDGNFTIVSPNSDAPLFERLADTAANVTFTYNSQLSLPTTDLSVSTVQPLAVECDGTPAEVQFQRSSTRIDYPLALYFGTSGSATVGDDVALLPGGLVLPTNESQRAYTIAARADSLSESDEILLLSLAPSPLYQLSGANSATLQITDCFGVLPVDYLEPLWVEAYRQGAKLGWTTAQEWQNDYFVVQRSTDGRRFKDLAEVPARADGGEYGYYDATVLPGINYYRLLQWDRNGQRSISNTVQIAFDAPVRIAPNPTEGVLWVELERPGDYQIRLLNLHGQILRTWEARSDRRLQLTDLTSGLYLLEVRHLATGSLHLEKIYRK